MKKFMLCVLCLGLFLNIGFAAEPEETSMIFFDAGYPPFYMANMEEGMLIDAIVVNRHVVPYEMKLEGYDPSEFVFAEVPLFEFGLMTKIQKPHIVSNVMKTPAEEHGLSADMTEKLYTDLVNCFIREEMGHWRKKHD